MRCLLLPAIGLLAAAAGLGTPLPITISDPYGGTTPGTAKNNGDVIGLLNSFDIDTVTFTTISAMEVEAVIRLNYNNGDATLSPFSIGPGTPTLRIADLLFEVDGVYVWGVPLSGHDLLTLGALYEVTNGQPFAKDARWVLGDPTNVIYRPEEAVWIKASHARLVGGNLDFDVTRVGNTSAVEITLSFIPTDEFLSALGKGVTVHLAAATCANDVLDGHLQYAVPEPATVTLAGLGLLALALARRRR
jgi:hypothetical protein